MKHFTEFLPITEVNGNEEVWLTDDSSGAPVDRRGTVDRIAARALALAAFPPAVRDAAFVAPGGTVSLTLGARAADVLSVRDFGAVGDGVADDTAAIQAAINAVNAAGGGVLRVPFGRYRVTRAGTHTVNRGFCIVVRSNVTLDADFGATFVYAFEGTSVDVVMTEALGTTPAPGNQNITIRNLTVETTGSTGGSGGGFNFWMRLTRNLVLDGIVSIRSPNWGIRVEKSTTVQVRWARSEQGSDVNADGLHFMDCRNVIANTEIFTEGDDGLIIEAFDADIWNYHITAVVRSPVTAAAAGRGVLILNDHPSAVRRIENIYISASVFDCKGSAFMISGGGIVENLRADIVAHNCQHGLYLVAAESGKVGAILNSHFTFNGSDFTNFGVIALANGGTIVGNSIAANVRNPATSGAVQGARLEGTRWTGSLAVDYDPTGVKTAKSFGLDMFASNSRLTLACRDASVNLYLRASATGNTFDLGVLSGATFFDIQCEEAANAADTRFVGGRITTTSGTSNCTFVGVGGAGPSATFTTTDGKTVVVSNGIVRSITP